MDISKRFESLRLHLGLSMRGMSQELGLSASLWSAYESGKALPSFEVLQALRNRSFNVNWILDGTGSMLESQTVEEPRFVQAAEERVLANLKIGRMAIAASQGFVVQRGQALIFIVGAGSTGVTLGELNEHLAGNVAPQLLQLLDEGLVLKVVRDGVERYVADSQLAVTMATEQDKAQAGIEALDFLARKVIPAAHAKPSRGLYIRGSAYVEDPYKFMREIRAFLSEKSAPSQVQYETHSLVNVLFGATID